jgi:hypothetical protein
MAKESFTPTTDPTRQTWLNNIANKIGTYAMKYNISAAEQADVIAVAAYFAYWNNYISQMREYVLKLTAYKNEIRDGVAAGGSPSVEPTIPVFLPPPTAPSPGGFKRVVDLGNSIKKKTVYTVADGQDMGLEGSEVIPPNPATLTPVLKVAISTGGFPLIKWDKPAGVAGIHLYRKIGSGSTPTPGMPSPGGPTPASGYVYLASDTEPDYLDTSALPASGQSEQRSYVAIYFDNDSPFGQWSAEVKITVTGII